MTNTSLGSFSHKKEELNIKIELNGESIADLSKSKLMTLYNDSGKTAFALVDKNGIVLCAAVENENNVMFSMLVSSLEGTRELLVSRLAFDTTDINSLDKALNKVKLDMFCSYLCGIILKGISSGISYSIDLNGKVIDVNQIVISDINDRHKLLRYSSELSISSNGRINISDTSTSEFLVNILLYKVINGE